MTTKKKGNGSGGGLTKKKKEEEKRKSSGESGSSTLRQITERTLVALHFGGSCVLIFLERRPSGWFDWSRGPK
jgi:hypothetical protein